MSRLGAGLEAGALMRKVAGDGGFAAVLHRGDGDGSLLLILRARGVLSRVLERGFDGAAYRWTDNTA